MHFLQIGILIMISMHVGAQVIAALHGEPLNNFPNARQDSDSQDSDCQEVNPPKQEVIVLDVSSSESSPARICTIPGRTSTLAIENATPSLDTQNTCSEFDEPAQPMQVDNPGINHSRIN
jgi:hypothetical protein